MPTTYRLHNPETGVAFSYQISVPDLNDVA